MAKECNRGQWCLAYDRIDALRAQVAALEGERDGLRRQLEEGNAEGYGWKPRAVQAEAERGKIQEAAYRLTERVRNCLPSLGMGRVPNRDMLLKVEQYVGELEDALRGEK